MKLVKPVKHTNSNTCSNRHQFNWNREVWDLLRPQHPCRVRNSTPPKPLLISLRSRIVQLVRLLPAIMTDHLLLRSKTEQERTSNYYAPSSKTTLLKSSNPRSSHWMKWQPCRKSSKTSKVLPLLQRRARKHKWVRLPLYEVRRKLKDNLLVHNKSYWTKNNLTWSRRSTHRPSKHSKWLANLLNTCPWDRVTILHSSV